MGTNPGEFADLVNELLDGVLVCSDKLCHIETDASTAVNPTDFRDPTVKVKVLGAKDCAPCVTLKEQIGSNPKVQFIYMDDDNDPNADLGFEIIEKAGWSGTTPAVFIEQNGEIVGELWEGDKLTPPGELPENEVDEPGEDGIA